MANRLTTILLAGAGALSLLGNAQAAWPDDKPIRMIVGFEAGGGQDGAIRLLVPYVQKALGGASIVVINKPGASGELAYATVAQSPPDGYTFSTISVPGFMTLQISGQVNFEPKDVVPVARIVDDVTTLAVNAASPYRTLADVARAARAKPDTVSFGGSGIGTDDHLSAMMFRELGVKFNYVPFRGGAGVFTAILGSHIDIATTSTNMFGAGVNLRPIAVLSDHRVEALPNVPTAQEQGFDVQMSSERGIATHAKVPVDIRRRFAQAVKAGLDNPEFQARAKQAGYPLAYLDGDAWANVMVKRRAQYQAIWDKSPWQ